MERSSRNWISAKASFGLLRPTLGFVSSFTSGSGQRPPDRFPGSASDAQHLAWGSQRVAAARTVCAPRAGTDVLASRRQFLASLPAGPFSRLTVILRLAGGLDYGSCGSRHPTFAAIIRVIFR